MTEDDLKANRCVSIPDPEEQMVSPSEVVQRPKVIYSDISGLYHVSRGQFLISMETKGTIVDIVVA